MPASCGLMEKWLNSSPSQGDIHGFESRWDHQMLEPPQKIGLFQYNKMEGFYMKRRPSDWLKYVKMYVHNGAPMTRLAEKYKFNVSYHKNKVNVYMIHGESPFTISIT